MAQSNLKLRIDTNAFMGIVNAIHLERQLEDLLAASPDGQLTIHDPRPGYGYEWSVFYMGYKGSGATLLEAARNAAFAPSVAQQAKKKAQFIKRDIPEPPGI